MKYLFDRRVAVRRYIGGAVQNAVLGTDIHALRNVWRRGDDQIGLGTRRIIVCAIEDKGVGHDKIDVDS